VTDSLVDAHAHFLHAGCGRSDWQAVNAARMRAGNAMGVTCHIASILGSFGHTSPTYFPSPADVTAGNDAMFDIAANSGGQVRVARGAIGIKLAASRRADDPLLDPICADAAKRTLPILHHIWQHRTREWPNQEISDGADLAVLAARHPKVTFILAHVGGGGDYAHSYHAVKDVPNIVADLSGSGVDRGMLDGAAANLGPKRLLWGTDLTMETGLAKLRALETISLISKDAVRDIRWRNANRLFQLRISD
jgi:predicted TIM-barrel fold metal-dependent hydrolase